MKLTDKIISEIESCKTAKQVNAVLKKHGLTIQKDTTTDCNCYSVWLDDTTRIYKPLHRNMTVQRFQKTKLEYSGIPVFFG